MKKIILCLFILASISVNAQKKYVKADSSNLTIKNNVAYTSDKENDLMKLNIVLPKGVEKPPVFMWIGGGAWAYVNRHQEMEFCKRLANEGVAVISVGHRLSPKLLWEPFNKEGIKHPEHVKDVAEAFKWIYDNAEKHGYDKNKIFIGGFSSGAQLTALLSTDGKYLKNLGLDKDLIKAVIPVGGTFDIPHYRVELLKEDPKYDETHFTPVFGATKEEHIDASPSNFMDQLSVPLFMISESETYVYTKYYEEKLNEIGFTKYDVLHVRNLNHGDLWRDISYNPNSVYRKIIADYIKSFKLFVKKKKEK